MLKRFWSDQAGTETVEWGVMAGLIVVATIGVITAIGGWVHTQLNDLKTGLEAA